MSRNARPVLLTVLLALVLSVTNSVALQDKRLKIHHQDAIEVVFSKIETEPDTVYAYGSVVLETASGTMIYCDTAVYAVEKSARLFGRVIIDDAGSRLAADDSVHYDVATQRARAFGDYVELFSESDSMLAVGTFAFFDRNQDYFYMTDRPTVYLNYPDSANMTEVVGDLVEYDATTGVAEVQGNVSIQSHDVVAMSGCAVMHPKLHLLDLYDHPVVHRRQSEIKGQFISLLSEHGLVRRVDVVDSAYAEFTEPKDSAATAFDKSILKGQRLVLDFDYGQLRYATCRGQAYSWYLPATPEGGEKVENEVSGDSVRFTIEANQLQIVDVVGGAMGTYLSTRPVQEDTSFSFITDTVNYRAHHISYDMPDSMITLVSTAQTTSGTMSLDAHLIEFDTKVRIIEAFSGNVGQDSVTYDNMFAKELQPNDIPVVLKDAQGDLYGDYLRYSIDTKKGRIVTSKSKYETGYFYGHNLYRQKEDIFYMEECRYTTCDAEEPHFHFRSKHIKLIEGNRLIAKPIYLYIGRLPILALPYYVFPLEKGRHSGLLPFTFGNFERGERYVKNVGYYWAASDYWDAQASVDYYDERAVLNLHGLFRYKKLYKYDGSLDATWGRSTTYNRKSGEDERSARWTISGNHNQVFSPSFQISATGSAVSDATYFQDFSNNLDELLNRTIRSQVTFTKKFGKAASLSGGFTHDNNLDDKSRTDKLPYLTFPSAQTNPFGEGTLDEDGNLHRHWYNELKISYGRPSLLNFSSRVTKDVPINYFSDTTYTADTTYTIDSLTGDTTAVVVDLDTLVNSGYADTLEVRSRKAYTRVDQSVGVAMPLTLAKYFIFKPVMSYNESWYKIHRTDQSDAKGIDASTLYRNYTASAGVSLSTKLYGTIHPNFAGLLGLRQVLSPTVGYSFVPTIRRHEDIAAFAGGQAGRTLRSQNLNVSLDQTYQAKVRRDDQEKNLDLLSVSSSFSYNFEAENRRFSELSTSYNSTLLRNPRINASTTHSFYKLDSEGDLTDVLDFWHPRLEDVRFTATFSFRGQKSIFDEPRTIIPRGADSASHLMNGDAPSVKTGGSGWDLTASYSFSESGLGTEYYRKSSFVKMSLRFYLTPSAQIRYEQYYNFVSDKTISNRVDITKNLHCWTGTFWWVPIGSTKGWGFTLYVTDIPSIKIDNNGSTFQSNTIARQLGN